MATTFIRKLNQLYQRSISMIFFMFGFIAVFLLLSLPSPLSAEADDDSYWTIADKWVTDQYNSNSQAVKGYFHELETKNRKTFPDASIEPTKLELSEAVTYHIPQSIEPDFALTDLWEYNIDTRSIIEARYERQERDAPLAWRLSFFIGETKQYYPLTFPFEVASLNIAKNKKNMPVLLSVIGVSGGSGTTGHIYRLTADNTLQELLALNMWQDAMVTFIDADRDENAEIFHATLADFPEELLTLIGPDAADGKDCRFYQAEIYQWSDDRSTAGNTNKFKRMGVKYYWEFPPFVDNDFSTKEGWERCYTLSKPWIMAENAKLPEQVQQYFAAIESWTQPPATSAAVSGVKLDLHEAQKLDIAEIETYKRYSGDKQTTILKLAELTQIEAEQESFVRALYQNVRDPQLFTLYLYDDNRLRKLTFNTFSSNKGLEDLIQVIKLGKNIPLLINTSSFNMFGDAVFYAITPKHALEEKLKLSLFQGGTGLKMWIAMGRLKLSCSIIRKRPQELKKYWMRMTWVLMSFMYRELRFTNGGTMD